MSYWAESTLCCTIVLDKEILYNTVNIQYNIFASNLHVIARENDIANWQECAGHMLRALP